MRNQDRYKTILVMVTGIILIARYFSFDTLEKVAIAIAVVAIIIPVAAKWIEWAWLKLALALGWINSRILLSIIYFAFLLPIALVSRLFTKDPLNLKARKKDSLYTIRNHQYSKEDLENIW